MLAAAAVLVGASAGPASALAPAKHRAILESACAEAGLPYELCRRAGRAAYETDYREWLTLAAHAQREVGQDRCPAADAAADRLDQLGLAIVDAANRGDYGTAADELGRAIHTLQDECAHHGMTNPEHAFYSMEQTCGDGDTSPDVQPAAIACATARTRDVMRTVATALATADRYAMNRVCSDYAGGGDGGNQDTTCAQAVLPTPVMGCHFLAEHRQWDGTDTTWDGAIVGPALVAAFTDGLSGVATSHAVCAGDDRAIDPPAPHPTVTDRDVGCALTDVGCLGRADDPLDGGADDDGDGGAGCRSSHGGTHSLVAVALVIVLIGLGRRHQRR